MSQIHSKPVRFEMTKGEQKMLVFGLAAGTIQGMAIGLIIAMFIVMT